MSYQTYQLPLLDGRSHTPTLSRVAAMRVHEFFEHQRLKRLGVPSQYAIRIHNTMNRECRDLMTMEEFLGRYTVKDVLQNVPGVGQETLRHIEAALSASGLMLRKA